MNCDVDELKRSMQQIGACMTWMILSLLVAQLQVLIGLFTQV
jgi:hypothetical protein